MWKMMYILSLQMFSYTKDDLIRTETACLDLDDDEQQVMMSPCQDSTDDTYSTQNWHYKPVSMHIMS